MKRILFASIFLGLSVSLLVATATVAQEDNAADYKFTEVIDVQLVNVEVWVTDQKGRAVTGLTAQEFEVLEDGQPVNVTYFAEVQGDEQVDSSLERTLSGLSPAVEPLQAPIIEPSHLVVYFDQLHLTPSSRRQAIADLREFLADEKVSPERVLILSQDRSLKTEATFGSSWIELDAALRRLEKALPRGGLMESEKRLAIRGLQDLWKWTQDVAGSRASSGGNNEVLCDSFLPRAVPQVEAYAAASRERISVTLDHLASVASFLTGIPGVKTLLYLSDSLERAPGTDLVTFINDLCPTHPETPRFLVSDELSRAFRSLTRHANANRVTIYALQTRGLQSSFLGGADQASVGLRGTGTFEAALRTSEREGLSTLAAETGGRTILNRNTFDEELAGIAREMSSYYSLGYEPPHGGDEREHEIEVRLKAKNLRARHRRGYRDKSSDQRMTERLQGAVYLGLVDNPMGVRLGAGTVTTGEGEMLRVPVHVIVPAESVVFLPDEGGIVAHLSLQVSTRNTVNMKGLFEHRAYRITWQNESEQEMIDLVVELEMPAGVHLVAVGVRDDATREASFVSTTLELNDGTES